MTEPDADLDLVFQALMHGTRRDMLRRLGDGELSVGELAAPLPVSLAAASKHVQVLERAGLIRRTVVGRRHVFRRDTHRLEAATAWLTGQAEPDVSAPPAAEEKPSPEKEAPTKSVDKKAAEKKALRKKASDTDAAEKKTKIGAKAGKGGKGGKKNGKSSRRDTGKAARKRSGKKGKRTS